MEGKYLVINAGSSSVKMTLFAMPEEKLLAQAIVERIGEICSEWKINFQNKRIKGKGSLKSHREAVETICNILLENKIIDNLSELKGIGHRILHGGSIYSNSCLIDDTVIQDITNLIPLGPLHHPGELEGIKCALELFPSVSNVAVFDTAFHQTMPEENYMYSVPYEWYQKYDIRRYGFHGTSHKYITQYMPKFIGKDNGNLIICHIGNGASIAAIKDGKCIDTSMGLTPLDGVMMGTRSGSIDPSIINYISKKTGKSLEEITTILNKKSGLLGIAGKSDYRDIEKLINDGDERAVLALKMFINRIVNYIARYYVELNGDIDGIVFTAGIGENSASFRKLVIDKLSKPLGIVLNKEKNDSIAGFKEIKEGIISDDNSKINIYVIPTNEEKMIMLDTYQIVNNQKKFVKIK